jgi:hypothetical protein
MAIGWSNQEAAAQARRFRAGVVGGLNASQITGDDVGGYNRLGVHGGLRAVADLGDKKELLLELLYSQRGSYNKYGSPKCPNGDISIFLQYVEVPVMFCFKDWYKEEEGYYKVQACGGFSYGRLLRAKALGSCHDDLAENGAFNTNDISIALGADLFSSPNLVFGARWTRSLSLLYDKDKHDPGRNSLRGYFLSFRTAYIF